MVEDDHDRLPFCMDNEQLIHLSHYLHMVRFFFQGLITTNDVVEE